MGRNIEPIDESFDRSSSKRGGGGVEEEKEEREAGRVTRSIEDVYAENAIRVIIGDCFVG